MLTSVIWCEDPQMLSEKRSQPCSDLLSDVQMHLLSESQAGACLGSTKLPWRLQLCYLNGVLKLCRQPCL